ncbi:unnamed protein product, partial [Rotaria magnacalcarata]
MHTGVDSYRKTRADGHVLLSKPHITFLAASNGSVVIEILRQKLKTTNVADAMVERFQWEALMACTKLNATRLVNVPPNSIGLELYFLASSLLTNHTFIFEKEANEKMCSWMDELALARARWDQIDTWFSSRLAKSIEQTARIAAELSHIELTMDLLNQFISSHDFNTFGTISFEIYCQIVDFIQNLYPPGNNTIIEISAKTVESAIYCMDICMIKYLNLFNIDSTCTTAILELPMHPPPKLETATNPSIANLPTTQQLMKPTIHGAPKNEFQELQKLVMLFQSISFTRTMLYSVSKLKARQDLLNNLLGSLVEIGLLKQFGNGVITGSRRSSLYIKLLPATETLNTTNQFTLDLLDKINLPWLLYRRTCTSLLLPSKSSILSSEATGYLQGGIYQEVITQQGVAKTNSPLSSVSATSANMNNIFSMIQSTDSDEIASSDTFLGTILPTNRIVNVNMPQPPPSTSQAMSSLGIHFHTNQNIDSVDESEDNSIKNQRESQSEKEVTINTREITDENDYSGNFLKSIRQSDRIKKSKRSNTTSSINRNEFCNILVDLIQSSLPLSLFHFALDIDDTLSPLLPNRDDHIAAVVEQTFKISIKPSKLKHYLLIFKQAACNDVLTIWHKKDINAELTEYIKKKMMHSVDVSHQYCSPIQIEPPDSVCPNLGHMAFLTFERIYNQLSTITPDPPLERRFLERVLLVYSMTQFEFFMGNDHAFLPRHLGIELDEFLDLHFDRWYTEFSKFWATHSSFKRCTTKCTSAIIIDGHMKLKRRLCYNQSLLLVPPRPFELVFDTIIVGCPESPAYRSKLCHKCTSSNLDPGNKNEKRTQPTKISTNSLSQLSCNVNKENVTFSDGYLRSCGVLLIATNCQIVIGFAEILRSESKKEVVQALANMYHLAPTLPRLVVYDAGCLLIKFIKANFNNSTRPNSINVTP